MNIIVSYWRSDGSGECFLLISPMSPVVHRHHQCLRKQWTVCCSSRATMTVKTHWKNKEQKNGDLILEYLQELAWWLMLQCPVHTATTSRPCWYVIRCSWWIINDNCCLNRGETVETNGWGRGGGSGGHGRGIPGLLFHMARLRGRLKAGYVT